MNSFVWYELVTADIDAALRFYGAVLGWTAQDFEGPGPRYVIVNANDKGVGGVMTLTEGMPSPFWLGYLGTTDIADSVARFTAAGGKVEHGPWEIPSIGRLVLLSDPQGAGLAMIQPQSSGVSEAFAPNMPGHGAWHELHAADPGAAFAFYADQFGWSKGEVHGIDGVGPYQIFKAGDVQIGGIMRRMDIRPPAWLFYFGVEAINAAIVRVHSAGGTILHGPVQVPGGMFVAQAKDPQGAAFALVGPA
jgi:predicted enzyme related to lactoylglutathione lyase